MSPLSRYLACMLSGAPIVVLLGGAAAYSGHHADEVPRLAAAVLLVTIGAGLPGALLIYRPLARYLASGADQAAALRRLRRLPGVSALWVYAQMALALGWQAGSSHGWWTSIAASGDAVLAAMVAHVALFALYIALYAYFLVGEHAAALRLELWSTRAVRVPPGRSRLAVRIVIGFVAVAAAPLLLLFADQPAGGPAAEPLPRRHAFVIEALQMDLVAAVLLTAMLVALIVRGVSRPVRMLLHAMREVDRGDLGVRVPVVSDDELGVLTERFNEMLGALAERERMRRTFSRFVPEEVAGPLLADQGAIVPQEREASVLYADIEGFTNVAGTLAPAAILRILNAYFREVAHIIHRHRGVITQFQGDAVLAGFNLPAALPDHARRAVDAALEIRACLDTLALEGGLRLRMRVGVATGRVIGGTVGGDEHLGYTLHGDTVNRAARLEELNKELGTRILIDGRTAELLRDGVAVRDHGAEALRGFAAPVRVFEPLSSPAPAHA